MLEPSRTAPPRLVIAGGGLAAWTAAAYLRRMLRRVGWTVTVVGPVPPAGPSVGLATRPILTRFLRGLGIDEAIFMRRCGATYRVASRFDDWFEAGQGHWHPFGVCGPRINGRDLFHYWLKHRNEGGSGAAYADYAPQALMAAAGRGPRNETGVSSAVEASSYGYHLDRTALVRFLREIALSEGVRAVPARVLGASRDFSGNIRSLDLEGGASVEGDLFLDCTGAAALLIGETLGEAWIADSAACDSLVSLSLPPAPDPPPFTTYAGLPEGWTASLPLAGRTEAVLAYDGETTTPEAAEAALQAAFGLGEHIVHRSLPSGRRNPWLRNVVALGAAARAVEPLAGFGLDLDLVALEAFVAHLPRGEGAEILRRSYTARMNRLHDDALEALAAHYVLGRRPEPVWAAARAKLPEGLADRLDLYEVAGHVVPREEAVFGETDYYLLFTGADFLPRRAFAPVDVADGREIGGYLAEIRARAAQVADATALHASLLEPLHGTAPAAGPVARITVAATASGPASLRRTPEGTRLADLVAGLGQPYGYERSVKATPGGLQVERFLVSLHRTSLGLQPGQTLDTLAEKLGLPERERAEAAGLIGEADVLHLGYEDGPSGALYKLYVEWSADTDTAWQKAETKGEPLLVHRAYKWSSHAATPPVVTLYHWPRVRAAAEIGARLTRMGADWGEAGSGVIGLAHAVLGLAQERGRGAIHYLEAREEPGPRLSYDLNLYACGLMVADVEPLLAPAFADLGIAPQAVAAVLGERRDEALGHVAGGLGRDGRPFLTVYSGMAGS
ncbi:tryptophan 7-halogenase [Methylobacterium thuringiense]|uniref:Tryptophan halogenase n=1 Tax=Methylobacterium thuringiense TaxID=1003091 RepID=A0ABQ4TT86_9HYPH|nr:tryptophan 7-halogenase [Methylobacterium thuringiense]GJE56840.1 hypothetical protein EKPJFOCH_3350 [Methylobacterium thuringiense]